MKKYRREKMKSLVVAGVLLCLLEPGSGKDLPGSIVLEDQQSAAQRAALYTGFDIHKVAGTSLSNRDRISDFRSIEMPPGMSAASVVSVWTVEFRDVEVNFHTGDSALGNFEAHSAMRDFNVLLDAETGVLIKLASPYGGPSYEDGSSPWSHLKEITPPGIGRFVVGLPEEPPVEPFSKAMASANCGNPDIVQEIEGYCIYLCRTGQTEPSLTAPEDSAAVWWVVAKYFAGEPVVDDSGFLNETKDPTVLYWLVDLKTGHGRKVAVHGSPRTDR